MKYFLLCLLITPLLLTVLVITIISNILDNAAMYIRLMSGVIIAGCVKTSEEITRVLNEVKEITQTKGN